MIELAQHIEAFTIGERLRHRSGIWWICCTLCSRNSCKKEENLFLPPTRTIGFNPQLKLNEGVLVQSYMSAYDTSFADATRIVEKRSKCIYRDSPRRRESPFGKCW